MPALKRVLILTADAGFGHRSAANSVAAALVDLYSEQCQVDIVNPLEDKHAPSFLRDSQSDYDRIVREIPELYRIGYDASDASVPSYIASRALTILLYETMCDVVTAYRPDVILTTYPLYQEPLLAVFTVNRYYVPIYTVVTYLVTVHHLWFDPRVEACLVPTLQALELTAHWLLDDGKLMKERSRNAFLLGKPEAAFSVAKLLWKAAQASPLDRKGKHIPGRPHLVSLLTRYRVKWRRRLQLFGRTLAGVVEEPHG